LAIDKQELHDSLKKELTDYSESDLYKNDKENPLHMKIMADVMKEYFEDKTEITYGWLAQLPVTPFTSDSAISFESSVKFLAWDLTSPGTLEVLALKIMASVATGVITHAEEFATVAPGSFLVLPLILPQCSDPDKALMKCIVEPVCDWYITLINPVPLAGAHLTYVGATTNMLIK